MQRWDAATPPPTRFPSLPPGLLAAGVQPRDLLYVSYTNVAGGVLPYMVLVHRPSKSVVLSVRGTGAVLRCAAVCCAVISTGSLRRTAGF